MPVFLAPRADLFALRSLPYPFSSERACPMWKQYLADVQPRKNGQDVLQMLAGLCLIPCTKYEVFFVLHGPSGTGKSVFLDVLRALVGKENVCCVPLKDMGNRFNTFLLTENLVNLVDDMPVCDERNASRNAEGMLKTTVTGGLLPYERKFQNRADDRPATARVVMATNAIPYFLDRSDALYERMRCIPFEQKMRGTQRQIPGLAEKIVGEELPGVFTWALVGLAMLEEMGYFPEHSRGLAIKNAHQVECDPVLQFLGDRGLDVAQGQKVSAAYLYQGYKNWCETNGHRALSANRFAHEVSDRTGAEKKTARVQDKPTNCFVFPKAD